ncbi:MAG: DUF106 domain-containing protein [Haloarculaceae archaeon]
MARTAQKVDELAADGESMTDALSTVLAVADEQGTVTWSDVSDDLTSGQWGRLIEKGLLVDAGGAGFVVDDPEGVRDALDEAEPEPDEEEDDTSWTTWDKLAAVGVVGLFLGYSQPGIRGVIGGVLDVALGPLNGMLPFYITILILSMLTGLYSSLMMDYLMDQDMMSDYQERQQELKERRKAAKERDDDEALDRIQDEQMEMMSDNVGVFKQQFRPMVWIMLLTIPVFLWLYWMVFDVGVAVGGETAIVLPLIGGLGTWTTSALGPVQAWLVWYFICSMGFNQIIRKALHVQTSPTS